MQREDYIMRLIAQLAEAVRRIAGRREKGGQMAAAEEARRSWDEVLGVPRELLEVTDTPTLAGLLKDAPKWRAAAELLAEEARGADPLHAGMLCRRALELMMEAHAVDPQPEDDNTILELARRVPANQLDERYR